MSKTHFRKIHNPLIQNNLEDFPSTLEVYPTLFANFNTHAEKFSHDCKLGFSILSTLPGVPSARRATPKQGRPRSPLQVWSRVSGLPPQQLGQLEDRQEDGDHNGADHQPQKRDQERLDGAG